MSTEDPGGTEPTQQPSVTPPAPPAMTPPPVMGQPEGPGAGWGAPAAPPTGVAMPPLKKSNSGMVIGIVVAVVAALAIGGYFLSSGGSSKTISLPETLAGLPRMHDATAGALETQFESGDFGGLKFQAALYGDGAPQVAVMAADNAPSADLEGQFTEFITGFTSTGDATVDAASKVTETRGDIQIGCVPAGFSGITATVCVWSDANIVGAVIDFRGGDAHAGIDTTESIAQGVTS